MAFKFRFRRTVKLAPGIRLNVGKTGISTSIGGRGARTTFSKAGTRNTIGIPSTGMSWTSFTPKAKPLATGVQRLPLVRTKTGPLVPRKPFSPKAQAFNAGAVIFGLIALCVVPGFWLKLTAAVVLVVAWAAGLTAISTHEFNSTGWVAMRRQHLAKKVQTRETLI